VLSRESRHVFRFRPIARLPLALVSAPRPRGGAGRSAPTAVGGLIGLRGCDPKTQPHYTATSVTLGVPSGEGAAITTPTGGSCGSETTVQLPSEAKEQEKLISILPHINYEASGIDKQPTIQFTGVNLQVINGSGSESTLNGMGNLILGYDENQVRRPGRTTSCSAEPATPTPAMAGLSGVSATRSPAPMPRSSAEAQTPLRVTQARSPAASPTRRPPSTPPSAAAARTSPAAEPSPSHPPAPTKPTSAASPRSSAGWATKHPPRTLRSPAARTTSPGAPSRPRSAAARKTKPRAKPPPSAAAAGKPPLHSPRS